MNTNDVKSTRPKNVTIDDILDRLSREYGEPKRLAVLGPIDALVQTILSQHTSDSNTSRAFASLKRRFRHWESVIEAPTNDVADAIRSGGLADVKASRIQRALNDVRDRTNDGFNLEFLADMPATEARAWLTSLHGVGPKTASCVLLFSLDRAVMPVDTHVHRVSLRLGLIPQRTSADNAHALLEAQIPDERMYDAHMLFIRHGKQTCIARRPRCSTCVLVQWCPEAPSFLEQSGE